MDPDAQAARKRQRLAMRVNRVPGNDYHHHVGEPLMHDPSKVGSTDPKNMIILWQIIAPVKAQKPMTSQPANHEIAGYMPGRLEFETEYENEAEQSVKDMLFSEEDAPEEVGMF